MPQACKVFAVGTDDLNSTPEGTRLDELMESKINTWLEEIQSQESTTYLEITNVVQSQNGRVIVITIFYKDGKLSKTIR
ncbi:hypothetical protein GF391_02050 [Candidatus Uhrbacteria bacterium]|nr:hypothetical protein [Candidatus Uhrbacteria bacterium]